MRRSHVHHGRDVGVFVFDNGSVSFVFLSGFFRDPKSPGNEFCSGKAWKLKVNVLRCVPKLATPLLQTRSIRFVVHGFQRNIAYCAVTYGHTRYDVCTLP